MFASLVLWSDICLKMPDGRKALRVVGREIDRDRFLHEFQILDEF
jgi:hypothetical protein